MSDWAGEEIFNRGQHAVLRTTRVQRDAVKTWRAHSAVDEFISPDQDSELVGRRMARIRGNGARAVIHVAPPPGPGDIMQENDGPRVRGMAARRLFDEFQLAAHRVIVVVAIEEIRVARLQSRQNFKRWIGYQGSAVNGDLKPFRISDFGLLRDEHGTGKLSNTTLGEGSGGKNEGSASLYGCLNSLDNDFALSFG